MSDLERLAASALLGVRRESLPQFSEESVLGQLALQMHAHSAESTLLGMAAAAALYQQAGERPARFVATADPQRIAATAPPLQRLCSVAVSRRLAMILDGYFSFLLRPTLAAMAERGLTAPPELLPDLLELGVKQALLRPLIVAVAGPRGQWLADQNPQRWGWAAPAASTWEGLRQIWQRSDSAARLLLLRQLRQKSPAWARQLLESTWKAETPSSRANYTRALEIGLSMDDEPFLEAALDDRDHTVRRRCAEVLAALTASRMAQRMTRNAADLLTWNDGEIDLVLPQEIAPQLQRDGVLARHMSKSHSVRSVQAIEMLRAVPLMTWTQRWGVSSNTIVAAAGRHRLRATLIRGFASAALSQRDRNWSLALLRESGFDINTLRTVALLDQENFQRLLFEVSANLDEGVALGKGNSYLLVLRRWLHPWSEEMGTLWLQRLQAQRDQGGFRDAPDATVRAAIKQFARDSAPGGIAHVRRVLKTLTRARTPWRTHLLEADAILQFRLQLLRAIEET